MAHSAGPPASDVSHQNARSLRAQNSASSGIASLDGWEARATSERPKSTAETEI